MKSARSITRPSSRESGNSVITHPILKQLAADSVFEFALVAARGGAVTFVNDRLSRATGHRRGTLKGCPLTDLLKKTDGKSFGPALMRPPSQSNSQKKNFSLLTRDGRLLPCSGRIYYFTGPSGSVGEVLVMGSRVKRKSMDAENLLTDHRLLQSLMDTLPDGFTVMSGKGVILAVNSSFATLTDRPIEALVSTAPPYSWAGREGNQRMDEAFSEVKKTGTPSHRLIIVDRPDRPAIAFSYWIAPLRGSFAGLDLFLSSIRDVTDIHPVAEIQMSERRIDRLKQQVQRNSVRLKTLQDINTAVLNSGSLPKIFKRITEGVGKLVDHDLAGIYVSEGDEKLLKPHTISKQTSFSRRLAKLPLTFGEGIIGSAAVSRKTVLVNDAQRDPRSKYPPGMKPEIEHIIASPLRGRGSVYGILVVARNRNPGFHEEDALVVQSFADAANVAIENMKLYAELGLDGPLHRRKTGTRSEGERTPRKQSTDKEHLVSPDPEEAGPAV